MYFPNAGVGRPTALLIQQPGRSYSLDSNWKTWMEPNK
jgi:hypothetical protein